MSIFLEKNWKFLLFPFSCCFIICIDRILHYPLYLTLAKIFIFSCLHFLYVLRTKYVFDSDIIRYYACLKYEFEKGHTTDGFLSPKSARYIFYFYYIVALYLMFIVSYDSSVYEFVILNTIWHVVFFSIFFTDFSIEVYRSKTNTADLSKVPLPASLSKVRFFSGMISKFTILAPTCAKAGGVALSAFGICEMGIPTLRGGFNKQGPLTNYYLNNFEYNDLACSIETRADTNFESAWHGYEEDVKAGNLQENPLNQRIRPIRRPSDLIGLSKDGSDLSGSWLGGINSEK